MPATVISARPKTRCQMYKRQQAKLSKTSQSRDELPSVFHGNGRLNHPSTLLSRPEQGVRSCGRARLARGNAVMVS
jgi:hypothetical protein